MEHLFENYDYSEITKFTEENLKEIWESNPNQKGHLFEYEPLLLKTDLSKEKIDQICELILEEMLSQEEHNEYAELFGNKKDVYNEDKEKFIKLNKRLRELGKKLSDGSRIDLIKSIINNKTITLFNDNNSLVAQYHSLDEILNFIKTGEKKELINKIRECSTKEEKKKLKNKLPQILFNGRFHSRDTACFHSFSNYMCLDFDGFEREVDLEELKNKLIEDEYVIAVFTSPSGNGLKIIIKVENRFIDNHIKYFFGAKEYFDQILDGFDTACKSIAHGCYLSYDPDIRIKKEEDVNLFNKKVNPPKALPKKATINSNDISNRIKKEFSYNSILNSLSILALKDEEEIVKTIFEKWERNKSNILKEGNTHIPLNNLAFFLWINGVKKERIQSLFYKEFLGLVDLDKEKLNSKIDGATNDDSKFNSAITIDWEFYHELKKVINNELELPHTLSVKGFRISNPEVEKEIEILRTYLDKHKFWSAKVKTDKEGFSEIVGYNISISQMTEFLKKKGFVRLSKNNSIVYYQNDNNILKELESIDDLRNYILAYVRENHNDNLLLIECISKFNYKDQFFSELKVNKIERELDTDTICKKYFKNGILVIDKLSENSAMVEYDIIDKPIFESQIINHNFDYDSSSNGDFKQFIKNVSGENFESFKSAIGYLCTNYKSPSNSRAVILNDPGTDFLEANGRRGKSLIGRMLSHVGVIEYIDGKSYKKDNQFVFANISEQTDVIFIDDVRQGLQLTYFYNAITEDLQVTKKGKDSFSIPFEKSPKLLISSNYPIKGHDGSSRARRFDLIFTDYYSENHTPIDDFGKEFFGSMWGENDWNSFYSFIVECIQFYMKNGFVFTKSDQMEIKELYALTSQKFVQFMEEYKDDYLNQDEISLSEISLDYQNSCGISISNQILNKWLKIWCQYHKYSYNKKGRKTLNGKKETIIKIEMTENSASGMLDLFKSTSKK